MGENKLSEVSEHEFHDEIDLDGVSQILKGSAFDLHEILVGTHELGYGLRQLQLQLIIRDLNIIKITSLILTAQLLPLYLQR